MAAYELLLLASLLASGGCTAASVRIGSVGGTWTGCGTFAGGRPLPAAGYLFYGSEYCEGTSSFVDRPSVVIARQGACSFDVKIRNAENNNVTAILLLVKTESEHFTRVSATKYYSHVSVIFISQLQGEGIFKLIDNNRPASIFITAEELCLPRNMNQSKKYLLVSAAILFVIAVVGGCYGTWYYRDQIENMNNRDLEKLQTSEECAIETTMEKIPSRTLTDTNEKVIEDYNTCAVCFENYKVLEIISSLPCSHIFHKNCVHPWLAKRRSCPLCKMDVLKHYGLPAASSEESILNIPLDDEVSYLEVLPN